MFYYKCFYNLVVLNKRLMITSSDSSNHGYWKWKCQTCYWTKKQIELFCVHPSRWIIM